MNTTGVVNLIILIAVISAQLLIMAMPGVGIFIKASDAIGVIALLSAIRYAFTGYKKAGATFYKIFMLLFAASEVVSLIGLFAGNEYTGSSVTVIKFLTIVSIAAMLVLTFWKDLGKKKTLAISSLILALYCIMMILCLRQAIGSGVLVSVTVIRLLQKIMMAVIACMIAQAKYVDKEERGRK